MKKKNIPFPNIIDNAPGDLRALLDMYKINDIFLPTITTSILQPMHQWVILTFMSYHLRNIFHKAIVSKDSDFTDGAGQSKLKTIGRRSTILDVSIQHQLS